GREVPVDGVAGDPEVTGHADQGERVVTPVRDLALGYRDDLVDLVAAVPVCPRLGHRSHSRETIGATAARRRRPRALHGSVAAAFSRPTPRARGAIGPRGRSRPSPPPTARG